MRSGYLTNTFTTMFAGCLVALLGSGCGVSGLQTNGQTDAGQAALELAPEFALADTDGTIVSLDDLLAGGQPTVLVFYRGHW
jgi:cytochrome oxidase Cu insertion factor (SCO1/SenC/PrrC family)